MAEAVQDAIAEANQATVSQDATKLSQIVTFKLGAEEYGVDIMKVQEIILMGEITKVPEVPGFIEGVINLRGNVIPIIDLRKRFQLSECSLTDETRVVVVNVENKTMGIIVDAVSEVLRIASDEIDPAPATIVGLGKEYLKGLVKLESRLLILLDINRILNLDEQQSVDDAAAQQ
ncbi:MAG: chemotaxis protein CheW [Deltaproteobacteria bacterium]|nr:chemotaxis protein CheW [Deltaproteobacteria bacterium]